MTATYKAPGQSLVITNQGRAAIFAALKEPTRELPTVFNRGAAAIPVQPALVAYERPIEPVATPRAWRPDLWPASIWVPLLMSMPVLGLGLAAAIVHALAN